MKLIELTITPDGNPFGEIASVIIDHAPDIFTSCYVQIVMLKDGSFHVKEHQIRITEAELITTLRHGTKIIKRIMAVL